LVIISDEPKASDSSIQRIRQDQEPVSDDACAAGHSIPSPGKYDSVRRIFRD
jgi:hypothetical protein